MTWLQSIDVTLFQWINRSWSNSVFDLLMPVLSEPKLALVPAVFALPFMLWRGPSRLRACLLFAIAVPLLGEAVMVGPLKIAVGRPRPAEVVPDTRLLVGRGKAQSMPSGHAANSFAVATVFLWFYRRRALALLPVAGAVAYSRVYCGAHYPSDVLAGAALGMAWASLVIWSADYLWAWLGQRWWPLWHQRLPSLKRPQPVDTPHTSPALDLELRTHWLRLGHPCRRTPGGSTELGNPPCGSSANSSALKLVC